MTNSDNPEQGDLFQQFIPIVSKRFFQLFNEALPENANQLPQYVFHYTGLSSAINIIEGQQIWSTNIAYLNDMHEVQCAKNVLNYTVNKDEEYIKNNQDKIGFAKILNDRVNQRLTHQTFVSSFCQVEDSLGQWRGYGSGVALMFDANKLRDAFQNTFLAKVVYDQIEQQKIMQGLITAFSEHLASCKAKLVFSEYEVMESLCIDVAERYFNFLACHMKNIHFKEENEWRLIAKRDFQTPLSEDPEVFFRERGKTIVPYIKIKPIEGVLPIIGAFLSPKSA